MESKIPGKISGKPSLPSFNFMNTSLGVVITCKGGSVIEWVVYHTIGHVVIACRGTRVVHHGAVQVCGAERCTPLTAIDYLRTGKYNVNFK